MTTNDDNLPTESYGIFYYYDKDGDKEYEFPFSCEIERVTAPGHQPYLTKFNPELIITEDYPGDKEALKKKFEDWFYNDFDPSCLFGENKMEYIPCCSYEEEED